MGSFKVNQDGVSIAIEWRHGALTADGFVRVTEAVAVIHRAVGSPMNGPLMVDAIEYDASVPA